MTTELKTIDLTPFCLRKPGFGMSKPWFKDGHIYATDGYIAVRVKADTGPIAETDTPKVATLPWPKGDEVWSSWPEVIPLPGKVECPKCKGDGQISEKMDCEECNGTGWHRCSGCGHEHECCACDGEGKRGNICPQCHGSGKIKSPDTYRQVGPAVIYAKYDMLIRALPNVEFVMPTAKDKPIQFRFDSGEGLIMPTVGFVPTDAPA